ncbi:MAG: hypothetical protein R3D86_13790 [Emcibacteraceae bacterium]
MTLSKFFAYLFLILGIAMLFFCGGCTLLFLISMIFSSDEYLNLGIIIVIGGIPTFMGYIFYVIGSHLKKNEQS